MVIRWNWVWETYRTFEIRFSLCRWYLNDCLCVCVCYVIINRLNEWWNARFFGIDFYFVFSLRKNDRQIHKNSDRKAVIVSKRNRERERARKNKKFKTSSILTRYCHLLYDSATIKWFMCRSFYFFFNFWFCLYHNSFLMCSVGYLFSPLLHRY